MNELVDVLVNLGYRVLRIVEGCVLIYDSPSPIGVFPEEFSNAVILYRGSQCVVDVVHELVREYVPKYVLWIGARGTFLEIACPDLESATKLLKLVKLVDFKHSGITSLRDLINVSLWSMYRLDFPVKIGHECLISTQDLGKVVDLVNSFVERDREVLARVCSVLKRQLGRFRS